MWMWKMHLTVEGHLVGIQKLYSHFKVTAGEICLAVLFADVQGEEFSCVYKDTCSSKACFINQQSKAGVLIITQQKLWYSMVTFYKNTGMNIKEPGRLAKEESNAYSLSDGSKIMSMNKLSLENWKDFQLLEEKNLKQISNRNSKIIEQQFYSNYSN